MTEVTRVACFKKYRNFGKGIKPSEKSLLKIPHSEIPQMTYRLASNSKIINVEVLTMCASKYKVNLRTLKERNANIILT